MQIPIQKSLFLYSRKTAIYTFLTPAEFDECIKDEILICKPSEPLRKVQTPGAIYVLSLFHNYTNQLTTFRLTEAPQIAKS